MPQHVHIVSIRRRLLLCGRLFLKVRLLLLKARTTGVVSTSVNNSYFSSVVYDFLMVYGRISIVSEGGNFACEEVLESSSYIFLWIRRLLSAFSNRPSDSNALITKDNFSISVYIQLAMRSHSMKFMYCLMNVNRLLFVFSDGASVLLFSISLGCTSLICLEKVIIFLKLGIYSKSIIDSHWDFNFWRVFKKISIL